MSGDKAQSDMGFSGRLTAAWQRFDEANAADPNVDRVNGILQPREWLYAQRLTNWVLTLCPKASEALRLAARCQHLCRWHIPRTDYEATKAGYLRWRNDLKQYHAKKSAEILRDVGYGEPLIAKVQALNLKKDFPHDPESRVLEDALCLVFLQYQLAELAAKTDDAKVINALQKSWKKMTPQAHGEALKLTYGERAKALIGAALKPAP